MRKNNLDEMQEKKLLNIEHNGMWLAFWGLLAVMIIQICMGADFKQYAGEWVVFLLLCIYTLICSIKNGIWDRHLKPNLRTNALISLLGALAVSVVCGITSYHNYRPSRLFLVIFSGVFAGAFTFIVCIAVLQILSYLYKKRKENLEQACDKD